MTFTPPLLWKAYFYLWLILIASTFFADLFEGGLLTLSSAVNLLVLALGAIALFGLAFEKPLASRSLWRSLFVLQTTLAVVGLSYIFLSRIQSPEVLNAKVIGNLLLSVLVLGPYFYGLYLYSYKRDSMWKRT